MHSAGRQEIDVDVGEYPIDGYTAPAAAIPAAGDDADGAGDRSRTLRECFHAFVRRTSPKVLAAVLVAAVVARVVIGNWSWGDLAAVALLILIAPFVEWTMHVVVLHAKPRRLGRLTIEMPNAKEHRVHHNKPADLDWVMIPTYLLPIHLTTIIGLAAAVGWVVQLALGGAWLPLAASTLVTSYAFLLAYEWTHFLMHSPYRPRSRYYRSIWKNHRLHHYKNEHHWFGITSTVADKTLHTAPDQRAVERSPTARALHGDTGDGPTVES